MFFEYLVSEVNHMVFRKAFNQFLLIVLFLLGGLFAGEATPAISQGKSQRAAGGGLSVLQPVYAPLAEQIVADFGLAEKEGIGIDLGSGPGNLIIELCRRTKKLRWINADIDSGVFPGFMSRAHEAGFDARVSAIYADAVHLPFRDNYADIITSRGSFQFWSNLQTAFAEIYRVLKPGGVAFIGRGFPDSLPAELAANIRAQQREGGFMPDYDVSATAGEMKRIMEYLKIEDYRIRIPKPLAAENVNYGIWIEFHKK